MKKNAEQFHLQEQSLTQYKTQNKNQYQKIPSISLYYQNNQQNHLLNQNNSQLKIFKISKPKNTKDESYKYEIEHNQIQLNKSQLKSKVKETIKTIDKQKNVFYLKTGQKLHVEKKSRVNFKPTFINKDKKCSQLFVNNFIQRMNKKGQNLNPLSLSLEPKSIVKQNASLINLCSLTPQKYSKREEFNSLKQQQNFDIPKDSQQITNFLNCSELNETKKQNSPKPNILNIKKMEKTCKTSFNNKQVLQKINFYQNKHKNDYLFRTNYQTFDQRYSSLSSQKFNNFNQFNNKEFAYSHSNQKQRKNFSNKKKDNTRTLMIEKIIKLRKGFNNRYQKNKKKIKFEQIFSRNIFNQSNQKGFLVQKRKLKFLNSEQFDSNRSNQNLSFQQNELLNLSIQDQEKKVNEFKRRCYTQNIQILGQNSEIAIIVQRQMPLNKRQLSLQKRQMSPNKIQMSPHKKQLQSQEQDEINKINQTKRKKNLCQRKQKTTKYINVYNFEALRSKHLGTQIKMLRSKFLKKQGKNNKTNIHKKFSKQQYNKYGIIVNSIQEQNDSLLDPKQFKKIQQRVFERRSSNQDYKVSMDKTLRSRIFRKDNHSQFKSACIQHKKTDKNQKGNFKILDPWETQYNPFFLQNQLF